MTRKPLYGRFYTLFAAAVLAVPGLSIAQDGHVVRDLSSVDSTGSAMREGGGEVLEDVESLLDD